jgi:hypothetical protein
MCRLNNIIKYFTSITRFFTLLRRLLLTNITYPKVHHIGFPLSPFPGNEYGKIETTLKNASNKGGFKIIRPRSVTKIRSK